MASLRTSTLSSTSDVNYLDTYIPGNDVGSTDVFGDEFAEDYAESLRTPDAGADNPFLDAATSDDISSQRGSIETIRSAIPPHVYQSTGRSSTRKSVNAGDAGIGERSGRDGRRHEETSSPETRGLMGSGRSNRSSSASSNFSFAPSRSSTGHATGPSHPYNMYPQDFGSSRSDSVASTSTGRPTRGQSRRGPQHPYTMYPQNVAGSSLAASVAAPTSTSDHDSIRPDDHSEQLPAYTRFPDEAHTKIAAGPPLTPMSQHSFSREMQERNPFQGSPFEPHAYGVATGVPAAHYTPLPAQQPVGYQGREKEDESAQRFAWLRRRACGVIPMWTICLTIAVVALIAIICGGVIGAFMNNPPKRVFRHLPPPNSASSSTVIVASEYTLDPTSSIVPVTVTSTQYLDASPIVTPTSISALPTGTYQLTVDHPASNQNGSSCLTSDDQRVAWSCNLNVPESWSVQIQTTGAGIFVSIQGTIAPQMLAYGTQPPILTDIPFSLVTDLDHPNLGPAYHFQTFYSKLVVLPAAALTPNTSANKRSLHAAPLEARAIPSNDQPWFCWFNETLIEGFVYVNHADDTPQSSSAYTVPSTPIDTSATAVTTVIAQLSAAESASTPCSSSGWGPYSHPTGYNPPTGWSPRPTSSCTATPGVNVWSESMPVRRQASSSIPFTPSYLPKQFRIEERRAARVGPAACTQMAPVGSWQYAPVLSNGNPVIIELEETDPAAEYVQWQSTTTSATPTAPPQKRDQSNAGACYCVWES